MSAPIRPSVTSQRRRRLRLNHNLLAKPPKIYSGARGFGKPPYPDSGTTTTLTYRPQHPERVQNRNEVNPSIRTLR